MKFLSHANTHRPFVVCGEKQRLRNDRRHGLTTARQQIKAAKLHRRLLKAA
jgi:hypothetical protein